jgi:hypothetical protein
MPLIKGEKASTKKGFAENIEIEMKAGKPMKQAVAIAFSEAERGKKAKHSAATKTKEHKMHAGAHKGHKMPSALKK